MTALETVVTGLDARLTTLEEKVESRPQETRPIWEQVLTRLDGLESRMKGLEGEVGALRDETRTGFRRFERLFGTLAEGLVEVRSDYRDMDRRLAKLEPEPAQ